MNPRHIPLILVFLGLGYGIWHYHSDAGLLRQEIDQLKASHELALQAKDEEIQRTLSAQNAQHQRALQTLNDEHDKKLGELRAEQRQQIARAYKEFENIFTGNKQTLDYIAALEAKMKAGQTLSKIELEKMVIIASGSASSRNNIKNPSKSLPRFRITLKTWPSARMTSPPHASDSSNASSARTSARLKRNTSERKVPAVPLKKHRANSTVSMPRHRIP